jgi:hypothetical protein
MKHSNLDLFMCSILALSIGFLLGGGFGRNYERQQQKDYALSKILNGTVYITSAWDNIGENTTVIINGNKTFIRYNDPELRIER